MHPDAAGGLRLALAWLADRDQETVFVGRDDDDGRRAGALAVAVGIRRLGGFLHGGFTSWRQERRAVGRIERVRDRGSAGSPRGDPDLLLVDVRERAGVGRAGTSRALSRSRGTRCASGPATWTSTGRWPSCAPRASAAATAASLLQRYGAERGAARRRRRRAGVGATLHRSKGSSPDG